MNEQKKERHHSTMTQAELDAWDAEIEVDIAKAKGAAKQSTKPRRKKFQANFVIFPVRWIDALARANANGNTYELALRLLVEAHARAHLGGDVVLSSEVTGLPRNSKYRAARKLQALGLIRIEPRGVKQSPVIRVLANQARRKPQHGR